MSKLDIKKELAKLPKKELIDLLCSVSIGRFYNTYTVAAIVHKSLSEYAYNRYLEIDKQFPKISLSTIGKASSEHIRVSDLDTREIENQLVALFNEAARKRDQQDEAYRARVSRELKRIVTV